MPADYTRGDAPLVEPPDLLELHITEQPFAFRQSRNKKLNSLISDAVNRMGGVGDDAEQNYQETLGALRESSGEAIQTVAAEYLDLPEAQYLDRWALVHLLGELEHPEALGILDRILSSEIPPERSPDPHGFSTVAEEVMIRTTAVEALARLSAAGNTEARELLLKQTAHPNFSVRRAAVQGLVASGGEKEIARLRRLLRRRGEEQLLDIRRADVREVPQATGGLFLVHPDVRHEPPPHDLRGNRKL